MSLIEWKVSLGLRCAFLAYISRFCDLYNAQHMKILSHKIMHLFLILSRIFPDTFCNQTYLMMSFNNTLLGDVWIMRFLARLKECRHDASTVFHTRCINYGMSYNIIITRYTCTPPKTDWIIDTHLATRLGNATKFGRLSITIPWFQTCYQFVNPLAYCFISCEYFISARSFTLGGCIKIV